MADEFPIDPAYPGRVTNDPRVPAYPRPDPNLGPAVDPAYLTVEQRHADEARATVLNPDDPNYVDPDLAQTATNPTPPAKPTSHDLYVAHGHKIIRDNLARAKQIGGPQIAQLLPLIEATLHALYSHSVTTPDDFAKHEAAVREQADKAAAEAKREADKARAVPSANDPNYRTAEQRRDDRLREPDAAQRAAAAREDAAHAEAQRIAAARNDTITGGSIFDAPPPAPLPPA
jgi:hypothetical protein